MKKTLAAVAVLGAFAGSALAADVTLYGRVDLGVGYQHIDENGTKTDNWGLESGQASGSRWGIKGTEDLGNGMTVGFQLEGGFTADDGVQGQNGGVFSRESRLFLATDYGTFHAGRFGGLDSGSGSLDLFGALTVSGTGYATNLNDFGRVAKTSGRLDNSIAYTSPKFAGIQVSAMASLGSDYEVKDVVVGDEASSKVDRYYALGLKGQWGALGAGLVVAQFDEGSVQSDKAEDDGMSYTAAVNYDFGVAKPYVAANYYDGGVTDDKENTQWGVQVGVKAPVFGGNVEASVAYGVKTAETDGVEEDTKIFNVGAMYKYNLSKRTYWYAGVAYDKEEVDVAGGDETKTIEAVSGIVHSF